MGQRFSLSHVLDVYRGSMSQQVHIRYVDFVPQYFILGSKYHSIMQVKKNMHDKLNLHGTGKSYSKGVVERILHKMVFEGILKEDISKSDMFGSISSILKVVMYP
jgi:bloom syndrome protein